jgi:hypothetical protein
MQQALELIRTTPLPPALSPPALNATKSGRIALESQALLALNFTQHGADSLPEAHAKLYYLNKELKKANLEKATVDMLPFKPESELYSKMQMATYNDFRSV